MLEKKNARKISEEEDSNPGTRRGAQGHGENTEDNHLANAGVLRKTRPYPVLKKGVKETLLRWEVLIKRKMAARISVAFQYRHTAFHRNIESQPYQETGHQSAMSSCWP